MADIFISYKREDKKRAALIAGKLEASGWSVWWDHDLLGGEDYDVAIERELDAAKCVVVIWSPLSIHSRNVRDEAKKGLNRNILVPVSFDHTEPPIGFGMTHVVLFENKNTIADEEFEKLYESVSRKIKAPYPLPPPSPPSFIKKYGYYVAGLIIIIAGYFIYQSTQSKGETKTSGTIVNKTDPTTLNAIDSENKSNVAEQNTQKFEDNLVLLVNDCAEFFKKSKNESLGYKKFGRVLDCIAFTSTVRLSEFTEDTIFNCSASGKTWLYFSHLIQGVDSAAIAEKYKEYKIKIEFALPAYKDVFAAYTKGRAANYTDGKISVMISLDKYWNQNFGVQIWISPQSTE